jgi:hypothetical protein
MKSILKTEKIDFDNIDDSRFSNPGFIEAYLLSLNPAYNKKQIYKLLLDYLL